MSTENNIGSSNDIVLFVVQETAKGQLTFPTADDMVVAAGDDANISQSAEFSDSMEIFSTLDILDQFPNATQPGEFSVPMYLRLDTTGKKIQGSALLENSFGGVTARNTAEITLGAGASIPADGEALNVAFTCDADIPARFGLMTLNGEQMMYDSITWTNTRVRRGGTMTIKEAGRGLNGTTESAAAAGDKAILNSTFFFQKKGDVKTLSLWMVRDHVVIGMSGCMVTENSVNVSNEGAVTFSISGNGMRLHWCGTMDATGANTGTTIPIDDPAKVSKWVRVYNATSGINNSGEGYTVTDVNETAKTITLDVEMAVANGDVIKGFLPDASAPIGAPVQAKYTRFFVEDTEARIRSTDVSFSTPRPFFTDEVGTEFPEDFGYEKRSTSFTMNIYFRKDDAGWIQKGMSQNYFSSHISFGTKQEGIILLPKCSSGSPTISGDGPVMSMSTEVTAIGTAGEDSAAIVINM